jgi:hypothetical protein
MKFDKEYQTQFLQEVSYLSQLGIRYVFVKTDSQGIRIYKYTKDEKLFEALMNFYKNNNY